MTREASLKVNDIEWQQTSELDKTKSRTSQQQLSNDAAGHLAQARLLRRVWREPELGSRRLALGQD
jgi:hypothetical protein